MGRARPICVIGSLALVAGCTSPLPDADSPGALLYQARCGTCHAPFQPRTLTTAMWAIQVERMRETMRRGGTSPLTEEEERVVLAYLGAHATDAGSPP